MEDNQDLHNTNHGNSNTEIRTHDQQPVRSRWTPKPEQILILESIFNSGMVNPPKDETVRIRKLLEKFGSVGDANVFYWFQNRRSRSRRRQRQLQAAAAAAGDQNNQQGSSSSSSSPSHGTAGMLMGIGNSSNYPPSTTSYVVGSSSNSSSYGGDHRDGFVHDLLLNSSGSNQFVFQDMEDHQSSNSSDFSSISYHSETSNLHYQTGFDTITVFINGVATEVPRGVVNVRSLFGEDVVLIHSSGLPLPTNELGFLMQSLQHGETYFLVSKQA